MYDDSDERVADLHVHTTASDGTVDSSERVSQAAERGLDAVAITDHDVIADPVTEPATIRDGVEVVAGVEVRADLFDTKVEVLGYYVDPTDPDLRAMLERARGFRRQRNRELVERLSAATGLELSYEELSESVEGNLGRPHLAERLLEEGIVDGIGEAFDEYLAEGGAAFVPMERLPVEEVVATIQDAGGVASLAHPGRIRTDAETVDRMVEELAAVGIDGIETWYPYGEDRDDDYADVGVEDALALADRHGLIPTGGSDCHGPGSGKFRIGDVGVPADALDRVRARSRTRSDLDPRGD